MRENQISREGEEEDNNGEKKQMERGHQTRSRFSGDTVSARNVVLNTIHLLCLET